MAPPVPCDYRSVALQSRTFPGHVMHEIYCYSETLDDLFSHAQKDHPCSAKIKIMIME